MTDKIYLNTTPADFGPYEWFRHTILGALARTDEDIDSFIPLAIISLTTLRCKSCSVDAFQLIKKRHPNDYKNIVDKRGERIGMWLWMFDLHNDVNKKLKKPVFPLESALRLYKPLLSLTTKEIDNQRKATRSSEMMDDMLFITFNTDENDFIVDTEEDIKPTDVSEVDPTNVPVVLSVTEPSIKPLTRPFGAKNRVRMNKKQEPCLSCGRAAVIQ